MIWTFLKLFCFIEMKRNNIKWNDMRWDVSNASSTFFSSLILPENILPSQKSICRTEKITVTLSLMVEIKFYPWDLKWEAMNCNLQFFLLLSYFSVSITFRLSNSSSWEIFVYFRIWLDEMHSYHFTDNEIII